MAGYKGVPTIRKRLVGSQLRRLREDAGISVEAAASKMGIGHSSLRRQESGHTFVSVADARAFVEIYQVADETVVKRLMDLVRHSRQRGWWSAYGHNLIPTVIDLADIEDLAVEIKTFQPIVIPGLFQTPEYTEAVVSISRLMEAPDRPKPVSDLIALRERRKLILERDQPPRVWAIIGEAAILTQVGNADVMHAQLQHLLSLSRRSNVNMQVLPFSAGAHLGMGGSFLVMSVDATVEGSVTLIESSGASAFIDDPEEVESSVLRFTHLQTQAMSTGDTQKYLLDTISAK
jgi:transcriptional regulator with XRE-family HTH domain